MSGSSSLIEIKQFTLFEKKIDSLVDFINLKNPLVKQYQREAINKALDVISEKSGEKINLNRDGCFYSNQDLSSEDILKFNQEFITELSSNFVNGINFTTLSGVKFFSAYGESLDDKQAVVDINLWENHDSSKVYDGFLLFLEEVLDNFAFKKEHYSKILGYLKGDIFLNLNMKFQDEKIASNLSSFLEDNKMPQIQLKLNYVDILFNNIEEKRGIPFMWWFRFCNLCCVIDENFEKNLREFFHKEILKPLALSIKNGNLVYPEEKKNIMVILFLYYLFAIKNENNLNYDLTAVAKIVKKMKYHNLLNLMNALKQRFIKIDNESYQLIDDALKTLKVIAYVQVKTLSKKNEEEESFISDIEKNIENTSKKIKEISIYSLKMPNDMNIKIIDKIKDFDELGQHKYLISFCSLVSLSLKYFIAEEFNIEMDEHYKLSQELYALNSFDKDYVEKLKELNSDWFNFYLFFSNIEMSKIEKSLDILSSVLDNLDYYLISNFFSMNVSSMMEKIDEKSMELAYKMISKTTEICILDAVNDVKLNGSENLEKSVEFKL